MERREVNGDASHMYIAIQKSCNPALRVQECDSWHHWTPLMTQLYDGIMRYSIDRCHHWSPLMTHIIWSIVKYSSVSWHHWTPLTTHTIW